LPTSNQLMELECNYVLANFIGVHQVV